MLLVYSISKMKNIKTILLGLVALGFMGCSSSSNNGPAVHNVDDLTGVYRTDSSLSDINSVTSIEIINGQSETDLEATVLRNGLSFNERVYFNNLGEVQWADDRFGRAVALQNLKEGLEVKTKREAGVTYVDVCSDTVSLDARTMDFQYCLSLERTTDSLIAEGELSLDVFEFGVKVHTIVTPYRVFIKDRWFVDYFGDWSGQLTYKKGNSFGLSLETGQRLDITFQPIAETQYILRPFDTNQTISLYSEVFVLFPETRDMSELEGNANPYINFIYRSTLDGSREIRFNSFVHSNKYIEGNIELRVNNLNPVILGTYSLDQVK